MRPRFLGLLSPVLAGLVAFSWSSPALAIDSDEALVTAGQQVTSVTSGVGSIKQSLQNSRVERTPQQQIADAVLLMGAKDYDRAAGVLNQVIEKYPDNQQAYPDDAARSPA